MHFLATLPLLLPLASAAAVTVTVSACPAPTSTKALYFLDNNPAGAGVYALSIADDGTLSNPVRTGTGGMGQYGLSAPSVAGMPAAPGMADTLFSQDAVVVSGEFLFTVNAGSNTVSLFNIPKNNPLNPELIGEPADTKGEFPQSVAYSPQLKTACVLNGGAVAGVTCFSVDSKTGLKALGGLRPIENGQTTPPVGPPSTVSDILFSPSASALVALVKGNGSEPGFIYTYPVHWDGSISSTPVVSRPADLPLPFGSDFLGDDSKLVVTDPSFGAALVDVSPNFELSVTKKIPVAGQKAICWSVYAQQYDSVFVFDGGLTNITVIDPNSGDITGEIDVAAEAKGNLDAKVSGQFLYVLNGAPFVTVIDNSGLGRGGWPKQVQNYDLSSLGSRQGFQGLAIYPS